MSITPRRFAVLLAAVWSISFVVYALMPPSPDQFEHGYLGWRWISGDVLYRDSIDMNWPGVPALHAAATFLFGVHLWSWRLLDFALMAGSSLFLADLLRRASGRPAAAAFLLLYPVVYIGLSYWVPGQHDMSAAQFLLGVVWFHARAYERPSWRLQIATGLFIAGAMLQKPTTGLIGLALPIQALACGVAWRRVLLHTTVAGAASVLGLALAFGGVLASGTTSRELVDAVYTFNAWTQYDGAVPFGRLAVEALIVFFRWVPLLSVGALPGLYLLSRREGRTIAGTSLHVLLVVGVLSYFFQRRAFGYHLSPALPALSAALAVSLTAVPKSGIFANPRLRLALSGLLVAGLLVKAGSSQRSLLPALLHADLSRHYASYDAGGCTVLDCVRFEERLKERPRDEPLMVIGSCSAMNYISARRKPTRIYLVAVLFYEDLKMPLNEQWQAQWERDLESAPGRYCLVALDLLNDRLGGPRREARTFQRYIAGFHRTGTLGGEHGLAIFERN